MVLILATQFGADAHPASDVYIATWAEAPVVNEAVVPWDFGDMPRPVVSPLGTTDGKQRIIDGAAVWNDAGEPFHFDAFNGTEESAVPTPPPLGCWPTPKVFAGTVDGVGGTLAWTRICSASGVMTGFAMMFDTGEAWYTGTGTPASHETDLMSVAVHEFGHATGWLTHWDGTDTTLCPSTSSRHVMCPTISSGVTWGRTLKDHDSHTFGNAY